MVDRLVKLKRPWTRRFVSLLVVVSICASFVPVPTARPSGLEKDRSIPFPCQDRPCGCGSAEECWRQCCCYSNAQKLAWAKANGVTPPDFVLIAEVTNSEQVGKNDSPPETQETKTEVSHTSCCEKGQCANPCAASTTPDVEENVTGYVIGFLARSCQGQGSYFNALPWAVMPETFKFEFHFELVSCEGLVSAALFSQTAEPPEPPPRLSDRRTLNV